MVMALALLGIASCGHPDPERRSRNTAAQEAAGTSAFTADSMLILRAREEKNALLQRDGSPIPQASRKSFLGLTYFPPASDFVFDLPLKKLEQPEPFSMGTTTGEIRTMRRYGTFTFTVGGVPCTLTAFTPLDHPTSLFIPFKDATNGGETYEAGRYIDMEINEQNRYQLDMNLAYNPYCAYNPSYSCPLVPAENVLPVAIRAGEKLPPGGAH